MLRKKKNILFSYLVGSTIVLSLVGCVGLQHTDKKMENISKQNEEILEQNKSILQANKDTIERHKEILDRLDKIKK